jgi:tetratricopeptide (TPR) repeat protein
MIAIMAAVTACMSPLEQALFDGNKAFDSGKWDEAVAKYNEVIRLDPNNVMAYTNRGAANVERKNYVSALVDYNKAVELDPKNYFPYYNRMILYITLGDQDKAIADCNTIITDLELGNHWVYYHRAIAYAKKGETNAALSDLQKAMSLTADATFRKRAQDAVNQIKAAPPPAP